MGELQRMLLSFLHPLRNEHGEVVLDDDGNPVEPEPTDPPEGEPGEPPEGDPEPEDPAEPDPALKVSDGPPESIPYERFKEVNDQVAAGKESQTKLEQFKTLGPEGYYKLYPDEKPEDTEEVKPDLEVENLAVQDGEYAGKTINEVFQVNPAVAMQLVRNYYKDIDDRARATVDAETERSNASNQELKTFANVLNSELNDKDGALTDAELKSILIDEQGNIAEMIATTLTWMNETGRGKGDVMDGYLLMTYDQRMDAKAGAAMKSIVSAIKADVPSISSKQTVTDQDVGFSRFANMTKDQAADALETMSDQELSEFYAKAPDLVRKKYPSFPWD